MCRVSRDRFCRFAGAVYEHNLNVWSKEGSLGRVAKLSHPTLEHFLPTLFSLGVADARDELRFFNTTFEMASISMRSFVLA